MDFKLTVTDYSIKHGKLITIVMVIFTLVLGSLIPLIKIDTDPENMLSENETVRVFAGNWQRFNRWPAILC